MIHLDNYYLLLPHFSWCRTSIFSALSLLVPFVPCQLFDVRVHMFSGKPTHTHTCVCVLGGLHCVGVWLLSCLQRNWLCQRRITPLSSPTPSLSHVCVCVSVYMGSSECGGLDTDVCVCHRCMLQWECCNENVLKSPSFPCAHCVRCECVCAWLLFISLLLCLCQLCKSMCVPP